MSVCVLREWVACVHYMCGVYVGVSAHARYAYLSWVPKPESSNERAS